MLWQILLEFLFRLAFGLSAAMLVTSSRWVSAGFFRVHLWVCLGLNTAVAALVYLRPDMSHRSPVLSLAILAGVLSYLGAVVWLYERATAGRWLLLLVSGVSLAGSVAAGWRQPADPAVAWLFGLQTVSSGLLLGFTFAAMLLGHWYLNTPTMQLLPLRRLVIGIGLAVCLRALVAAPELAAVRVSPTVMSLTYALLAIRWLAGLAGVLLLAILTWLTLKIPNTQSATGILYVAVIFTFLGELSSLLLSVPGLLPV
jgi:hypothetical protein